MVRRVGVLRGKNIFRQGEPAQVFYRIEHGCVRLQIEHLDGHRQVIAFLFTGQTFCAGFDTHWASADAMTDTVLSRFPHDSLRALTSQDPSLAESLIFSADKLLTELAHHLSRVIHLSAYERMRWFVDWLASHPLNNDEILELPMSRQDIADFLGLAPETVSRLLRRLMAHGVLRPAGTRRYRYAQ